ncbi:uncharacterized protein E5676_scaffold115G00220 [Cucumis melo var. makuwa]|uniref:Uncharacterized protein n=1 Tax=Cucumis melo var. makuwa TaxID=1194695 RepID=A0A5D3DHK0_CUCMM|nr:uncharacterized protein E5676_scaffold115G00220 [Cucumis melo var. makuwa]
MNPLLLLNLIVLVTLVDSLGFIVYDLDEEISKADFANVHYYWMIYVCKNNLSQVYLHALALHPSNHITSHYKVRWLAKHDDYLQEGVQNLIDCPIHLLSNPKPPSKKCPVATSTPPTQFKFSARSGTDNVGKDIHILTTGKCLSTHTEDSQSNNDDRHLKRPKRSDKQSIDDEKAPIEVFDVAQFFDITSLMSSLGDHVLQIEGTSKPMVSPEVLSISENSKIPIGATAMSTRPLVIKASPQRVEGLKPITASEISHFCADNLISDLQRKTVITLWESLRQKIIRTLFERVSNLELEMHKIFDAIVTSSSNSLDFLRELVGGYFQGVENHNQMHSSILLQSTKDAQLMKVKGFVQILRLDENCILEQTSIVQRCLAQLSAKEAKLEEKLKVVWIESNKLYGIISENEMKLKQKQNEISKTCEEIDKLECAPHH